MHTVNLKTQTAIKVMRKQKGVTMIEYALIAALVAIAALVTLTQLGTTINSKFEEVRAAIAG